MSNGYSTTVFPNGVTNAPIGTALCRLIAPDPTVLHSTSTTSTSTRRATGRTRRRVLSRTAIVAGDGGWLSLAQ
jgi:hypothetical protein